MPIKAFMSISALASFKQRRLVFAGLFVTWLHKIFLTQKKKTVNNSYAQVINN